ncbi:hypothetical protein [Saccharopolyspora dendranthemae]|uniref:Uncharacterized protein n=1 Tax=Saccharopolyspora dendranthemae TaxID=1181886 RepID=A0A561U6P7_9PSEU|nr:hypothetical protein [Saccharopolyspora dendranthemae]TWF95035.1 hypothetical protein FHU35_1225 [Saccharopolyspora dendranthemae]
MQSRYATLPRDRLATLLPELLLVGQLIDRSAMAWCISSFGREEMTRIAIEEWMAASPLYTRRMQHALDYRGDDVVTIFKGLQLDIGAPPQFMDFRYTVHDPRSGEFHLDHCGALMDVEPMGERYVRAMCHDIEDPTFDATAVATNPKAQVRPVHRPPRVPADRRPHCAWTVIIDDAHPPVSPSDDCVALRDSRAATLELSAIDPSDDGRGDYAGPLLSDLDFADFSSSALVRMADEVCVQMHLLNLGFVRAVARRTADPREICTKQLVGIAGLAAERIHRALGLPDGVEGALRTLELHPLLNPANYVVASRDSASITVRPGPAHDDGAWISLCGPDSPAPLQAVVRAVDPRLDVVVDGSSDSWTARVISAEQPASEFDEVAVTRISSGANFVFQPRKSIPITPVR